MRRVVQDFPLKILSNFDSFAWYILSSYN